MNTHENNAILRIESSDEPSASDDGKPALPPMSERLSRELGAMLDQYDSARRAAEARVQQARDDERLFLTQFTELARTVVRPVFEAAGEILRKRGHEFSITEHQFAAETGGKPVEGSIQLRVAPAGMEKPAAAADDDLRALTFTTRHYNKTVSVKNGAAPYEGAMAGAKGAYPLAKINQELVEDEVLKLMTALVKS
jgi:hypothetical protein